MLARHVFNVPRVICRLDFGSQFHQRQKLPYQQISNCNEQSERVIFYKLSQKEKKVMHMKIFERL